MDDFAQTHTHKHIAIVSLDFVECIEKFVAFSQNMSLFEPKKDCNKIDLALKCYAGKLIGITSIE